MRVHQFPIWPDRVPAERPPAPSASSAARLRAAFADIAAIRIGPRDKDERNPSRRGRDREAAAQPQDATEPEPAAPGSRRPGSKRIDLLT